MAKNEKEIVNEHPGGLSTEMKDFFSPDRSIYWRRMHPELESKGPITDMEGIIVPDQMGVIVVWSGDSGASIVYSPESGMAIIPRLTNFPLPNLEPMWFFDYTILPLPAIEKEGYLDNDVYTDLKDGALIAYDTATNYEGQLVAINIKPCDSSVLKSRKIKSLVDGSEVLTKIRLSKCSTLKMTVPAMVIKYDGSTITMWNDTVGMSYIPRNECKPIRGIFDKYYDILVGDLVKIEIVFQCIGGGAREDCPWRAVTVEPIHVVDYNNGEHAIAKGSSRFLDTDMLIGMRKYLCDKYGNDGKSSERVHNDNDKDMYIRLVCDLSLRCVDIADKVTVSDGWSCTYDEDTEIAKFEYIDLDYHATAFASKYNTVPYTKDIELACSSAKRTFYRATLIREIALGSAYYRAVHMTPLSRADVPDDWHPLFIRQKDLLNIVGLNG